MKIGAVTIENSLEVPQNTKERVPEGPVILLLCILVMKMKTLIGKDKCTHMFIAMLFTTVKMRRKPKYPVVDK